MLGIWLNIIKFTVPISILMIAFTNHKKEVLNAEISISFKFHAQ